MNQPIRLNPQTLRLGLGWAQSWTNGPILCVLTPEAIRFVVVNERRFIASWEWVEETEAPYRFFLIPPFIANTLASQAAYNITGLRVRINRTHVALTVHDPHGEYVLQWRWLANSFAAPPFFDQMAQPPAETLREAYIAIADAVHLAIANLGRLEALERFNRNNLAIVVDFSPGSVKIDGQPITQGEGLQYYFDPRLIMRGLEIVRGRHIGFALTETIIPDQAVLYMTSQREQWRVTCALLSILPNEQTTIISQRVRPVARQEES
ncbi:MAG: hypothetical protein JW910_03410 [Anaerolineae bacterium]|nr:hypothetical protein [Anaerolineae bacterium]